MSWIGVDLDRTLAYYDKWKGYEHIGEPIHPILTLVKTLLHKGENVRIFTARCYPIVQPVHEKFTQEQMISVSDKPELQGAMRACNAIIDWCITHVGERLPITCVKDYSMEKLYDDRAVQVLENSGSIVRYAPNLTPVIQWLEAGCDVKEAIAELKIYQELRGKYDPLLK